MKIWSWEVMINTQRHCLPVGANNIQLAHVELKDTLPPPKTKQELMKSGLQMLRNSSLKTNIKPAKN